MESLPGRKPQLESMFSDSAHPMQGLQPPRFQFSFGGIPRDIPICQNKGFGVSQSQQGLFAHSRTLLCHE